MWYEPKYTPKEYDEKIGTKVLNDVEKENLKTHKAGGKGKGILERNRKNSVKKRLLLKFFYAKIATVRYHFAEGMSFIS